MSRRANRMPDFFIVGAPRCGTTFLYGCLASHPDVFMSPNKEPHFFGSDLTRQHAPMSRAEYAALFRDARDAPRVGEASPLYMYSRTAAQEIHDFDADARIILMLRRPVDLMYSLHRQNLFTAAEDVESFEEALALEPMRRQGHHLPRGVRAVDALFYRDVASLADQVGRFLSTFPPSQVHVILFDDLVRDGEATLRATARFLGISETWDHKNVVENAARRTRSRLFQGLVVHPPRLVSPLVTRLRRYGFAHRLRSSLLAMNGRPASDQPKDAKLIADLTLEFAAEVYRLGQLLGTDLTPWQLPPAQLDAREGAEISSTHPSRSSIRRYE